jgi:hypothetical protein
MIYWKEPKTKEVPRSAWSKAHPPRLSKDDKWKLDILLDVMNYDRGQWVGYRWKSREEHLDQLENGLEILK